MDNYQALKPLPPPTLMGRVAGSTDAAGFDASGQRTIKEWARTLSLIEKSFHDFPRVVDFGCGCGRALRHLRPNLKSTQELFGIDVDGEAIEWVANNYSDIVTLKLDLLPPSTIEGGSVDLIVNQSVFTHLPEDVQFAWLAELHRIVKAGGFLILTFHGRKVWNEFSKSFAAQGHHQALEQFTESYKERGFFYIQGRNELELQLPEYYGSAFHTIEYIEKEWSRWFRCHAWLPVFSLNHQDVLLLQKM